MNNYFNALAYLLITLVFTITNKSEVQAQNISDYNPIWNAPCKNSLGSMPLGNGDIGVNAWVEESGDLIFYISKTDAWSDNARLVKLGKVRVSFSPNLVTPKTPYFQELQFKQGQWVVKMDEGENKRTIVMWVDANNPVIHVDVEGGKKFKAKVSIEPWRTERRQIEEYEKFSFFHSRESGEPIYVEPDSIVESGKDELMWLHHNKRSVYRASMELQGLESIIGEDPLLHRTFGGLIRAEGLTKESSTSLISKKKTKHLNLSVHVLTMEKATIEEWKDKIKDNATKMEALDVALAKNKHLDWWNDFWNTSWVKVSGKNTKETNDISRGWYAHRYLMGCAGRGKYPIKYNGSLFTVDAHPGTKTGHVDPKKNWDADYRNWGEPFWFQNQRQVYWPMIATGDFELMKPFFKMYRDALPLAKKRTELYYDHKGAFFPETMLFWGTYANSDYGYDRNNKPLGLVRSGYVKRYWQGGLELSVMMLEYFKYTQDTAFLEDTALPIIKEVVTFFANHWPLGKEGKIEMYPAQALETYWNVKNPLPEIAGMKKVLQELMTLTKNTTEEQRNEWARIAELIPDYPIKLDENGVRYMAPAWENFSKSNNVENVALYSVFPYRQYGLGFDDLEMIQNSFHKKDFKGVYRCWHNDPVYAAYLGLTDEARIHLGNRFVYSGAYRFPAFYIHGDWVPDHDNGGVAQQTLHAMLLQPVGDKILLFPAWPKEWDVDFKLHAPLNTTIEAVLKDGKIEKLKVTPKERLKDITIMGAVTY
ncbi:DUF5703 domain-containing protein [Flavivirga eckloniae]|uniref:Uncharacterized protein n=1 Tax=Flavivirga eckloniae TaxID=1803846 RepID=A0A2K9PM20_9FLAO|nr:DUF5703 domain-containing protein [Flavivirga eckloniae]AUP78119.1 hypothetical protein C1H87_05060 [Flavivirga eckloniae]